MSTKRSRIGGFPLVVFIIADPVLYWLWNIGVLTLQLLGGPDQGLKTSLRNLRFSFFLITANFYNDLFGNTIRSLLNVEGARLKFPTRIVELSCIMTR